MLRDMNAWLRAAPGAHRALPILSFPGIQLIGAQVDKLVLSGRIQADCMKAVAARWETLAAVSLMDLSVEAEAFGAPVRFSGDEVPTVTGAVVQDEAGVKRLRVPKVGDKRTGEYIRCIELASKEIVDRPVFAGAIGPFSLGGRLMDMTEIMVNCLAEPDLVHETLEKVVEFLIPYYRAFRDAGANGIVMAEPAAGLLSPELIATFSSPYVKRIREAVETENFLFLYHNCGNTVPLIPAILATGARAMHFGNAVRLADVAKLIPADRVFLGNVDPAGQFRNGTPDSIAAATRAVLADCGRYPNYIPSSGCDIPPVTPLANIDAFFRTVKEFYSKQ